MPRVLRRDLDCLLAEHNADVTGAYERIRARFNMFGRNAAEFAYLNATCFNGLYREDYDGRFNSPRGSRANERLRAPLLPHLEDCSVALRKASLRICDFGATCLQQADRGDLWYFDPPYDSIDGAGFTGYTSRCWNRAQASRLQREVSDLARRKRNRPRVMVSGPDTPFIRDQYSFLHCHELDASHAIGGKKARRRAIKELVFTNYEV